MTGKHDSEGGLQPTNEDKRRVVELFLKDKDRSQWSDREIARRCDVTSALVAEIRRNFSE
jgi:transposase-like protein